jgi:hypothetical protein
MRRRRPLAESDREEEAVRVDARAPVAWAATVGELASADAGTRAAVLGRLQQGSGNASVSRMLARRGSTDILETDGPAHKVDSPEWTPVVEPHGDGVASAVPEPLSDAAESGEGGLAGLLEGIVGLVESAAGPVSPGAPPAAPAAVAGPIEIGKSVGAGGKNEPTDVKAIGDRLKALGFLEGGETDVDAVTVGIRRYQADALGWPKQDGRVDPGGKTLRALNAGQKPTPRAAPVLETETPQSEPAKPQADQPTGGGGTTAPRAAVDATIQAWSKEQPKTNPEYAKWILDGARHGFVILENNTKKHLETFSRGGKIEMNSSAELGGTVDGSADVKVLGTLEIVRSMVLGRATRWLADPSIGKQPFQALSLARNLKGPIADAHRTGAALDAGGFDWGGPNGPKQVVQVLRDLPPGKYAIGLPYQGKFFSVLDSLLHFKNDAMRAAKASGGQPADVTQPGLEEWTGWRWTAKWNAAKQDWDAKTVDQNVRGMIKDPDLRAKLGGFDGKTFALFPDRPSHIHIQRL